MSEFGGLWQHQNNPACNKSVKSLQSVEAGHYKEEEEKEEEEEEEEEEAGGGGGGGEEEGEEEVQLCRIVPPWHRQELGEW